MAPRLFPVGHYLGPFFPGPGQPMRAHRIRIGAEITSLLTDDEYAVWSLAHGVPGRPPLTRSAIADVLREHGGGAAAGVLADGVAGVLAELIAGGALVEVSDAAAFARGHRFEALLLGLGTGPDRPDLVQLGLVGHPMAAVDTATFEVWQWAPRHASIWDAHVALGSELEATLARLHVLVANGCGYIDVLPTRP